MVGLVDRMKSAKSRVSSVMTLGSRGRNPDFLVFVFIGSGRDVRERGVHDFRNSDTRGMYPFFWGWDCMGGCEMTVTLVVDSGLGDGAATAAVAAMS